ncbi:hypothetical protein [Nostoc sp. TCL240-02]|uniref:hypothetical protein n=1 Tax=Nostoc sp. TCL240-02 TaxID=2572090 RepID=UPI00157F8A05|nr:hypothetical protein [Nostoc sp. TCL240-02]QKQ75854.1 hypothetical protein FBB35_23450 [Nostoc sp. TCL240-02]
MQLHNYNQLLENSSNLSFKYREIEVPTRSSFTVDDCIVIERETENLKQELVDYVVPSRIFLAVQSYQELWQDAQRVLAGLKKLGLKPQDFCIFPHLRSRFRYQSKQLGFVFNEVCD